MRHLEDRKIVVASHNDGKLREFADLLAPFGFEAPEEIVQDVILHLPQAHGYGDSKGLLSARRAVA